MMRSSIMIYCAILATIFLKKKLYRHHTAALVSIVLGVSVVGYSYITDGGNAGTNIILGLVVLQIG